VIKVSWQCDKRHFMPRCRKSKERSKRRLQKLGRDSADVTWCGSSVLDTVGTAVTGETFMAPRRYSRDHVQVSCS